MSSGRSADFEKEVEKEGGQVSALEEEAEIVQAQQPLGENDLENAPPRNELPFSKARCIALVVTVTGAAFLNVRWISSRLALLTEIDARGTERRHYSADHWPRARHSRQPPAMDRVFVQFGICLLPGTTAFRHSISNLTSTAPLGPPGRRLRQAPHLHLGLRLGDAHVHPRPRHPQ